MTASPTVSPFPTPALPVAWGEVFDKLTILQIKQERIQDAAKRVNVMHELNEIERVIGDWTRFPVGLTQLVDQLREINAGLWDVEDGKRDCERRQCFDQHFIGLARRVYFDNDRRAAVKKQINLLLGSAIVEEKSYQHYG